jgi:hypothetical protein
MRGIEIGDLDELDHLCIVYDVQTGGVYETDEDIAIMDTTEDLRAMPYLVLGLFDDHVDPEESLGNDFSTDPVMILRAESVHQALVGIADFEQDAETDFPIMISEVVGLCYNLEKVTKREAKTRRLRVAGKLTEDYVYKPELNL